MVCKECKTDGYIKSSEIVTEGDDSPDTNTKVFHEAVFYCRNPKCNLYEKEIGKVKNLIYEKAKA